MTSAIGAMKMPVPSARCFLTAPPNLASFPGPGGGLVYTACERLYGTLRISRRACPTMTYFNLVDHQNERRDYKDYAVDTTVNVP